MPLPVGVVRIPVVDVPSVDDAVLKVSVGGIDSGIDDGNQHILRPDGLVPRIKHADLREVRLTADQRVVGNRLRLEDVVSVHALDQTTLDQPGSCQVDLGLVDVKYIELDVVEPIDHDGIELGVKIVECCDVRAGERLDEQSARNGRKRRGRRVGVVWEHHACRRIGVVRSAGSTRCVSASCGRGRETDRQKHPT